MFREHRKWMDFLHTFDVREMQSAKFTTVARNSDLESEYH